jgi:hypothetical protein
MMQTSIPHISRTENSRSCHHRYSAKQSQRQPRYPQQQQHRGYELPERSRGQTAEVAEGRPICSWPFLYTTSELSQCGSQAGNDVCCDVVGEHSFIALTMKVTMQNKGRRLGVCCGCGKQGPISE